MIPADKNAAETRELTLNVGGMTCGGCERALSAALSRHPAVESARADSKTGQVVVRVRGEVDEAELDAIILAAGYQPA